MRNTAHGAILVAMLAAILGAVLTMLESTAMRFPRIGSVSRSFGSA